MGVALPILRRRWPGDSEFTDQQTASQLFGAGEVGAFYTPWDTSSLYQGRTASDTFADASTDPVGIMFDKSQIGGRVLSEYVADPANNIATTLPSSASISDGGSGAVATYDGGTGVLQVTTAGSSGSYPRFLFSDFAGPLVDGQYYYLKMQFSGDVSYLIQAGGSGSPQRVSDDGTGGFEGIYQQTSDAVFTLVTDGRSLWSMTITEWILVPIPGYHAVAVSDAARPQFQTSGGLSWLQPDGVDDRMLPATPLDFVSNGTANAWEHIGGWRAGTNTKAPFGLSGENTTLLYVSDTWGWYDTIGTTASLTSGEDETADHVLGLRQDSASALQGYFNGVAKSTIDPYDGVSPTWGFALFSRYTGSASLPFDGRFYGGVWRDRPLTGTQRSRVSTLIGTKVGLSI